MVTSIGKYSKSVLVKVLVGIIILPFVFWGMGDVFRGGNQNVIATIDSEKVNTQEFVNYVSRLNLNEEQIKSLAKTDLIEKILSEYIGRKVMSLEIEKIGIIVNDNSLRDIIKNDKLFSKDNKFSRTKYEKFLLESGLSAPVFEQNIVEQESRRQLLSFLSGGLSIPDNLIEEAFKKENQTKTIKYIDLDKLYSNIEFKNDEVEEIYEKNKDSFIEELKSIRYAEITPQSFGTSDYDEIFFKKLDEVENKVLDGQSFEETIKENSLNVTSINKVKKDKTIVDGKKIENLSDNLFKNIYKIRDEKVSEIINVDNKYFLAEIQSIEKKNKPIDDPDVQKIINLQIKLQNKIKNQRQLIQDISLGGFDKAKMQEFAKKNNLKIEDYKISNLKQNEIFSEGIIKKIFLVKDNEVNLITNSDFSENFLILSTNTNFEKIKKDSNNFEQYEAKARLELINKIYRIFDENLNQRYKVELNKRTIDRVKNSF